MQEHEIINDVAPSLDFRCISLQGQAMIQSKLVKTHIFSVMVPCSLANTEQHFGGAYWLHLQGTLLGPP